MKKLQKEVLTFLFMLLISCPILATDHNEHLQQYTHSHPFNKDSTDPIRALYVDKEAKIVFTGHNTSWVKPIVTDEDDKYLKLLKEIYVSYNGSGSANHLLMSFEVGHWDQTNQGITWSSFFLGKDNAEFIPYDFCSAPPSTSEQRSVALDYETIKVNIESGIELDWERDRKGEIKEPLKVNPKNPYTPFPITQHIDNRWIALTRPFPPHFPHSELAALNEIARNPSILGNLIGRYNSPQGLIIKFHSYKDICPHCQEAISEFYPILQNYLKQILLFFVGINNTPYGCNNYFSKEAGGCVQHKASERNMALLLAEGVEWQQFDQSKYVCIFSQFLPSGAYKPFAGEIKKSPEDHNPYFFIYLKQPDLSGIPTKYPF